MNRTEQAIQAARDYVAGRITQWELAAAWDVEHKWQEKRLSEYLPGD